VDAGPAMWAMVHARIATDHSVQPPPLLDRWQTAVNNFRSLRFSVPVAASLVLSAVVGTVLVMNYLAAKPVPNQIAGFSESRPESRPAPGETPHVGGVRDNRDKEPEVLVKETEAARHKGSGQRMVTAIAGRHSAINPNATEARTPSQLVRDAEKNYLSAIAMLTRDVAQRPSQLDSETRAKLDGALASIDRTISATRRAVKKNPNDPLAVQYMLTAYARKVDVLKEMTTY